MRFTKFGLSLFVMVFALIIFLFFWEKVPAGNVGVKVYLLGTDKGVDTEELGPGRYYIGWNQDLFLFPTFTQTEVYNGDATIGFQTKEGLTVSSAIGISYAIDPNKVNTVFQKYRKGVEEISQFYLRQMILDAFINIAGKKPIESVYGEGKAELIALVEARVREQVAPIGINVERIYWSGQPVLPEAVVTSINEKIQATQKAQQRENEVAEATAAANKVIETARGEAESTRLNSIAQANAIKLKTEALRNSPELVQLTLAERWNGVLPTFTGGATPLIDFRNFQQQAVK